MATTLRTSGIQMGNSVMDIAGSNPSYPSRAWVNFNGTGTVAIRADGNVSTIGDNGTGDYTINFSTALPSANYGGGACCADHGVKYAAMYQGTGVSMTALAARLQVRRGGNHALGDSAVVCFRAVTGNL